MKTVIKTTRAPRALGPYSQGIVKGDFCFVSMELGIDPKTNQLKNETLQEETNQALTNLKNILEAADFYFEDVVKVTLYISDLSLFKEINEYYANFFKKDAPARALIVQKEMPLGARVAVDAIAYKG